MFNRIIKKNLLQNVKMIKVRIATINDAEEIFEISKNSFKDDSWSLKLYEAEFSDSSKYYFVATIDDEVVGFIGYAKIFDEAEIMNIAVKDGYRNQGIGKTLIGEMIAYAKTRGITAASLEVRESNVIARHLYQSTGFIEKGIRPHYYGGTEDAVILWNYFSVN